MTDALPGQARLKLRLEDSFWIVTTTKTIPVTYPY
jgi:hypothetical protein